jgi:hypothetical protein
MDALSEWFNSTETSTEYLSGIPKKDSNFPYYKDVSTDASEIQDTKS